MAITGRSEAQCICMTFGSQQSYLEHETVLVQLSVSRQLIHLRQSILCTIPCPLESGMLGKLNSQRCEICLYATSLNMHRASPLKQCQLAKPSSEDGAKHDGRI